MAAICVSMARFSPSGTSAPVSPKPAVKSISMPFIARAVTGREGRKSRGGSARPASTKPERSTATGSPAAS